MNQELVDIPGYGGKYQLNTQTRQIISNSNWSKGSVLEVFTNRQGVKRVNLCLNGKVKQHKLDELIKETINDN